MGFFSKLAKDLEGVEGTGISPELIEEEQNSNPQINPEAEVDFQSNVDSSNDELMMEQRNRASGSDMDPDSFRQDDLESGTFVDSRMIDAGINEQFGNSLSRGVGTVLGGFGDIFQAVPGLIGSTFGSDKYWKENTLSSFFHEAGDKIQADNQNFIPEEFKEVSLASLGSVEGWKYLVSNQIAETLPYMAEFILTGMGAGAAAKKGASILAKKQLAKLALRKGSIGKAVSEGAVKSVSRGIGSKGAETSLKTSGLRNKVTRTLLNEDGLSKAGAQISSAVGAGAANNQLIAISQSAEAINEAKMYKDDDGNPLFNEDELAQIGVDTWQTESAYIAADIMSWGFTFGNLSQATFRGVGSKMANGLTKTTGARVAKVLAKAGIEGTEETVQEVFEEWAKKSSIAKAKFEKGVISEKEYLKTDSAKGFYDYYTSKETEGLRIVAGLTGGLMAGTKASIDMMAEKSSILRDKEELLKRQFNGENEGIYRDEQIKVQQSLIADLVQRGDHDSLEQVFRQWVKSGSVTEEEYTEMVKDANQYVEVFNKSQNLNVEGVERLYSLLAARKEAEILFKKKSKERTKSIADFKEMKLTKDADLRFEKEKADVEIEEKNKLEEELKRINKEVENHILGKKAEGVKNKDGEIQKDEEGNTLVKGFSDKDYKNYTKTGQEAAEEESVVESAVSKATGFFKNIFKSKKKEEDKVETPEETKTETAEEVKPEEKIKEESKPTYTEDEFADSLVTNEDKFDYVIDQAALNTENKNAGPEAYEKVFGKKPTKEEALVFQKYMNSVKNDNSSKKQNKLRNDFTVSEKPKVETPEKSEPNNSKKLTEEEQKQLESLEEDLENLEGNSKSTNSKDDSSSGKLTKEQQEDKDFLEGDSKPTKKSKPEPKGRFRQELGEESDNRKNVEEEAAKEKISVKAYLSKQVQKLKDKAKNIRESKEVEDLLKEINSIEEFNEFKNTKFYKELIALKSDKIIQQTYNKLVEELKTITSPGARRSVLNKIKAIDTARKVKSVESNLSYVTEKVTKETKSNLYTIEEIHSLNGLSADPGVNSKLSIIKQNLKKTHPEVDIVMVDDLSKILGGKKMAYVIGSTIFINAESVNQPDVIAHELSHIYYSLTKNTEATKRLVKNLARNTKRVDSLKNGYWDEVFYSFKAKNGQTVKRSAKQIDTEFDDLKQFLDSMEAAGYSNATELPIEEQEVILDELFAYNIESKIAGKYDAYFESDDKKRRLNFYEKGFFKNAKSKLSLGFLKSVEGEETINYLKDLDIDGIPSKTENLETFIAKEFKKGFPAKNIHSAVRGRNRFDTDLDNQVNKSLQDNKNIDPFQVNELIQTEEEAQKEAKQMFADLFRNVSEGKVGFEDNYQEDLIDDISEEEDVETSTLDDKVDVYTKSITNQLNSFVNLFNKKKYKDNRKDEIISRGEVMVPLMILSSQNFDSNLEFIKALEESDNEILKEYLRWLKIKSKGQYENRLVSTHTVLSDVLIMDSFVTEEGKNGININNGLSTQEQNDADTAIDYLQQGYKYERNVEKASLTDSQKVIGENFKEFRSILVKINKNIPLNNGEYELAFNAIFRNSGIDSGVVDVKIDSNFYTLKKALVNELKKASKVNVKKYANATVEFGNLDRYKLRPLINGVIAANRRYTSGMMAQNSDGNNVSMMQKSMSFISETKIIARDIANPKMTIGKFSKKYAKNPLAIAMFKGKKTIQFSQNLGITTFNGNSVYKDSKSDPLFTNDFVMFLKGGPNSYMQPMTVSGESARRYYSSLPKIKSSNMAKTMQDAAVLAVSDGDIRFETKSGNASGTLLKQEIDKEVERITEELESNSDLYKRLQKKVKKTLLRNDGKVSLEGKNFIYNYAINHTLNQIYLKNLYGSGMAETELSKRGKGILAPITPINSSGNMKLGIINVSDLKINSNTLKNSGLTDEEINATDSMNFVLPIDLSRVQSIFGTGMRVGNILKLFSHAKERDNTNSLNKNVTIKGLTFVLTNEFVNENPGYKPLRDALQAQRDYYIEMHNDKKPLPFNLNNGQSNFLPMAVASSALKTGGISKQSISIDELKNTETALAKINKLNEFNGGLGYGFNGAGIGIQNLMDKPYEKSVLGSQVQTNLFINSSNLGNLERVEGMQQKIFKISERKLKDKVIRHLPKDVNNITDKDLKKLKEFVEANTNKELVDPLTQNLLDKYSISLPYLQSKVSQILKNKIVKSGLRMYTDGTVGLQMADFGMYKVDGEGKYDSDLKSYGTGNNSTFWSDSRGKLNKSTTPAESLISDAFANKANTRLRSTKDYSEVEATVIAKKIAIEQAQNLGLTGKKRVDYENKHTQLLIGENEDSSWFVRGEFFLGTRIPSHGLQTTLVLEAKGTTKGMGSAIVISSELSTIMGSDFDGDALYMNMSNNNKKGDVYQMQESLKDDIIDYMTNEDVQSDLFVTLNIKKLGAEVETMIESITGEKIGLTDKVLTKEEEKKLLLNKPYVSTPTGQKEAFKDNVETRSLVGLAASLHRFLNVLSAYETPFKTKINIDGVSKTEFKDEGNNNSRSTKTALLLNVILDNANNKIAEKVGINPATASQYILLSGMGYEAPVISAIMLSDAGKAWTKASNNRNNPFYKTTGKDYVIDEAKKISDVKGKLNKDVINIDTKTLNSPAGKSSVLQLLNDLDKMQSEAFKINKILSTHKSIETNPFLLENQFNEFNEFINGSGVIEYSPEFRKSAFVQKYVKGVELAIDVNKKTNVVYSATGRNIMKSVESVFEKELTKNDYNLVRSKIIKALYMDAFKDSFNFETSEIIEKLYGKDNVFDRLNKYFIEKDISGETSIIQKHLNVKNESSSKRISLNSGLQQFGNEDIFNELREEFKSLPDNLANDLIIYDFVVNGLNGTSSIFPIFDNTTIQLLETSFNELLSKNAKSKNNLTIENQKKEIYRSLHDLALELPSEVNEETGKTVMSAINAGSQMYNNVVLNKPFIRSFTRGDKKYLYQFIPLSDDQISEIRTKNGDTAGTVTNLDFNSSTKNDMVALMDFSRLGNPIILSDLKTPKSEIFNDINILNFKSEEPTNTPTPNIKPVNINSKKKSLGRNKLNRLTEFFEGNYQRSANDFYTTNDTKEGILKDFKSEFGFEKTTKENIIKNTKKGIHHESFLKFQKYVPDLEYFNITNKKSTDKVGLGGFYFIDSNLKPSIGINSSKTIDSNLPGEEFKIDMNTDILFHEQVHSLLHKSLDINSNEFDDQFYTKAYRLWDKVQGKIEDDYYDDIDIKEKYGITSPMDLYGLTNVQEFVAEAISNPKFQKILTNFKSYEGYRSNIFADLKKAIKEFFQVNMENTVAEDAINLIGMKVFQQNHNLGLQVKKARLNSNIKPVNINSNKKSLGRNRLDGSEGILNKMTRDQWNSRNDLFGSSTQTDIDYAKYLSEYNSAQRFYNESLSNNQVEGMTRNEIDSLTKRFSQYQAEAASIINNTLGNELARRLSIIGTDVTGVHEGKDLSRGQKWFISSNIPSNLPAMQALARKVSERFKVFLRSRNESYDLIDKATKDLYKSKFDSRFVKFNPFKGKDHYKQLYGNLIVEEKVGKKAVNNIRLKDKSVIDEMFRTGKISKEEKAFYDVFTSITSKYENLLEDNKTRRGYIPHTKQAMLESYSNRGMLGAFMNFQRSEDKVRDVILKGYDPIDDTILTQSFKKFEDSYNAASENKEFGNKNKWKSKDLALIKFKAQKLQKKGINEDGTPIKMSSYSIETLANSGSRNRFTNKRANKATLYPSMDLNKSIMDFTHASAYADSFKDMLPEIQGLISYYKQKGNENAVKVLEVYYRDKIIRGKNPETLLGSRGDKALKLLNTGVVFSLLGFQTAFAAGNVIAGKYHNIKNGKKNGKEWAKGEKRFWGLDGAEKGIKGWASNFKSSMEFLKKIGFMEQNIYEDINLEKQWNPITKLETLALLPMTLSEKWIQGVQFLGMLSDEEWNDWKNEGKMISIEKQSQYEDDVKKSQGRGYNFTDQRMISLYSLGQTFMMFNKFIPTMVADRFNQEEIDAYGRKNIGSLRQFKDTAKDVISGRMRYSEFKEYRSKLEPHKQEALDKAVRGMALVVLAGLAGAAAGGLGDDDTKYLMDGLVMDANYAINAPKIARKLSNIPTISVTTDLLNPN